MDFDVVVFELLGRGNELLRGDELGLFLLRLLKIPISHFVSLVLGPLISYVPGYVEVLKVWYFVLITDHR